MRKVEVGVVVVGRGDGGDGGRERRRKGKERRYEEESVRVTQSNLAGLQRGTELPTLLRVLKHWFQEVCGNEMFF